MLTNTLQEASQVLDIHRYFLQTPFILFNLQKGFIPVQVLKYIISNHELGMQAFLNGWEPYLANLAKNPQWRLSGITEIPDFISSMMSGHIPSKDVVQSQGGIWNSVNTYDPSRNETRPTICPQCGSSFWSYENGNTWKAFEGLDIPEFRTERDECCPQIRITIDGREKKVCSHVISGPHPSKQAAEIACDSENEVAEIDKQWFVICGYQANLMSLYNYIHTYIMKPLRAEHRRFLMAKTKGRTNVCEAYNCPVCKKLNEASSSDSASHDESNTEDFTYECRHCGASHHLDDLVFFAIERGNVSLDAPLGDDGKATIGDLLPSPTFVYEELASCQEQIQQALNDFTAILRSIVDKNVEDAKRRYKERLIAKIPQLERSLKRARVRDDKVKITKMEAKLVSEQENLLKDQNKIEYSKNLVEMFHLHYIGDEEGNKYDLKTLTERFMFKSLPYTICRDCGNRDYEQNETGKLEQQQLNARQRLKQLAELGDIPGYDREQILSTEIDELFSDLGSFFHCSKCDSTNIEHFGHGMKNPDEPRVEITPHIFQPAQREIRELESQIFSYNLICPSCGTANQVRPDRMSGKILDHKISKRVIQEGGERKAIREKAQHRCQRCNEELNLEDVVASSRAKDAYSLLLKLQELVCERGQLKRIARGNRSEGDGWSVQ